MSQTRCRTPQGRRVVTRAVAAYHDGPLGAGPERRPHRRSGTSRSMTTSPQRRPCTPRTFGVRHETTSGPRPRAAAPASRRIIPLSYRLQALARSLARRRHCRHSHVKVFDTSGCRKSSRRYTQQYVRPAVYSAADAAIPRTDRGSGPRLSPRPPTGVGGRPASSTPLTTVPAPGARRTNPGSLVLYRSGS